MDSDEMPMEPSGYILSIRRKTTGMGLHSNRSAYNWGNKDSSGKIG